MDDMIEAQDHNSFHFADRKIKNLKELSAILENQSYSEAAKGFVTEEKNDFANWIRDVLLEKELSEEISKEKDILRINDIIKRRISQEDMPLIEDKIEEPKEITFEKKQELSLEPVHIQELATEDIPEVHHEEIESKPEHEELKEHEETPELHLEKEMRNHEEVIKQGNTRHFCPKFFECTRKEFFFGFALGIVVGIIIAILIKLGAV